MAPSKSPSKKNAAQRYQAKTFPMPFSRATPLEPVFMDVNTLVRTRAGYKKIADVAVGDVLDGVLSYVKHQQLLIVTTF